MSGKSLQNKSQTEESKKDLWNTDWRAVRDAEALIGQPFVLDACAMDKPTAKAPVFISPQQDSLKTPWHTTNGAVWCNPPFTMKPQFLNRASEQAKIGQINIMVMLPFEPCTNWWRTFVSGKATAVYMPDGRYSYLDPVTKLLVPNINFVSCFLLFTPLTLPTQYVEFKRGIGKHLVREGEIPVRAKVKKKLKEGE
ncbi:MAG: DNA N-6-adenine-methyltransferase [Alishewanella agri]|nr:DNA N-6-adenine-methyltransferase [Alishewanella agri]